MEHINHVAQAAGGLCHLPRQEETRCQYHVAASLMLTHALLDEESVEQKDGGARCLLTANPPPRRFALGRDVDPG